MRAILLAAGFGTRLRPITDQVPKCLVEIAGRPLLDYWLHDLHEAGVDEFLINTHYLADEVVSFIDGHSLRSQVRLVNEKELLGTAGTLMANREFAMKETTLLAHADNLCFCPWPAFFDGHARRPVESLMTMMTFETDAPHECGIVEADDAGIVIGFHEKVENPPGNNANAAVYLIEPPLIEFVHSLGDDIHDLSTQVLPKLKGRIFTWRNDDLLIDIGTPERLESARAIVEKRSPDRRS
ncbi:MAG: nucleotidyltransferase family protein [Verrucomicrobiota bacterium]